MGRNRRSIKNDHTRHDIADIVSKTPEGGIIFSSTISVGLSTRRKSVPIHTVGLLLRERDDVVRIDHGMWKKITVA